ncbi:hypothetical protein FGO68_gene9055 [Halteria grandinella]|uniref:Uncharacterized protein n=1 Tax=Halteria grandinella TaxID=5974 RepID=A0A8J8SW19_HALGN|nr:hypothetical protein FGO68_gene9055 [Halteria grandinella]
MYFMMKGLLVYFKQSTSCFIYSLVMSELVIFISYLSLVASYSTRQATPLEPQPSFLILLQSLNISNEEPRGSIQIIKILQQFNSHC